jgi:hypothetical protein
MKQLTIADVANLLGISVVTASNNERAGTLPFVRVGDHYTDPASAISAFNANRQTGYRDAPDPMPAIAARAQAKHDAERAAERAANEARWEANEAVRQRNEAARAASAASVGLRSA